MRLSQLIEGLGIVCEAGDTEISGITSDSRDVTPGTLFVALKGEQADGTAYIPSAIKQGAVAVLIADSQHDVLQTLPNSVCGLVHSEPRKMVSLLAARFYPHQPEHIVAITGTDGKTSVAHFCRQLWQACGVEAASIGTLGVMGAQGALDDFPALNTTPDPVLLHRALDALTQTGIKAVSMEASSHGLHQYRLDGVRLCAAACTNITRDHLDYHGTLEAYFEAKARLFTELLPSDGVAVLNADDPVYMKLQSRCRARGLACWTFGKNGTDATLLDYTPHGQGASFRMMLGGVEHTVETSLAGRFQVMNLLAALGLVLASGIDAERTVAALGGLDGVPGRLQRAAVHPSGAAIYVDYAHTPNALANALRSLRAHTDGKLGVVFGCGGDRDPGKRPEMGAIAHELADWVVVTDDNPRTEAPEPIRAEIMAACFGAQEIGDRRLAIQTAVEKLGPGDVLLIAGKGHEDYQIIGTEKQHFDDVEEARNAVAKLEAVA